RRSAPRARRTRDSRGEGDADGWTGRAAHGTSRPHVGGDADRRPVVSRRLLVARERAEMARHALLSREELLAILDEVKDPEVPVLSVVELGIVRDVHADEESGGAEVVITPTYSGCPAMFEIERDVR